MHISKAKMAKTCFQIKSPLYCPVFPTVSKLCIMRDRLFLEPHCQKLAIKEDLTTWHMWLLGEII